MSELLRSEAFSKYIYLDIRTNAQGKVTVRYAVDDTDDTVLLTGRPTLLARDANFSIRAGFVNPLKFSLASSSKVASDPVYSAADEFLTSLASLTALVGGTVSIEGPSLVQNKSGGQPTVLTAATGKNSVSQTYASPMSAAWRLRLTEIAATEDGIMTTACDTGESLLLALDEAIANVEKGYGKVIGSGDNAQTYDDVSKSVLKTMRELTSFSAFEQQKSALLAQHTAMVSANKEFAESLDKLAVVADQVRWKGDPPKRDSTPSGPTRSSQAPRSQEAQRAQEGSSGSAHTLPSECNAFRAYTKSLTDNLVASGRSVLATRQALAKSLKKVVDELGRMDASGSHTAPFMRIGDSAEMRGKIQDVTVTITPRTASIEDGELKVVEGKPTTVAFRVRERRLLNFEFAAGAILTPNLAYPVYQVETGTDESGATVLKVAETMEDQLVAPSGLLNLVVRTGYRNDIAHPMIQLGISAAQRRPSFLAGVGLRLLGKREASLSGGVLFSWKQQLDKLSVGDRVTGQAQIDGDVEYQLSGKPTLYLGVQLKL